MQISHRINPGEKVQLAHGLAMYNVHTCTCTMYTCTCQENKIRTSATAVTTVQVVGY